MIPARATPVNRHGDLADVAHHTLQWVKKA